MSYPLINGAAINAGEAAGETPGIELVVHVAASAVRAVSAAGAHALALGAPRAVQTARPAGLDLVSAGTPTAKYNTALRPAGLDLAIAAPAQARIATTGVGARPLEFGAMTVKIGVDVALQPLGIELARAPRHSLLRGQPSANRVLQLAGATALELGTPVVAHGHVSVTVAGAQPLAVGTPRVVAGLLGQGQAALACGEPAVVAGLYAQPGRALHLGAPRVVQSLQVRGLDLARGGAARVAAGGSVLSAGGLRCLELGTPGLPARTLLARQSFALELGRPSIDRGTAC